MASRLNPRYWAIAICWCISGGAIVNAATAMGIDNWRAFWISIIAASLLCIRGWQLFWKLVTVGGLRDERRQQSQP